MVHPDRPAFPEKRRIALVVGVDSVPESQVPALKVTLNARNDAEQMAQVLQEYGGFTLLQLQPSLLGEAATSNKVQSAILALAKDRTDDDFLLFYFSGHGHPLSYQDNQSSDVFLGTHDFKASDAEKVPEMHLSLEWLRKYLYTASNAGTILIILDCCYAGYMERVGIDPYLDELERRIREYFVAPSAASGSPGGVQRWALTATGHTQVAVDANDHGLMTKYLLDALRGDVQGVQAKDGFVPLELVYHFLFTEMPTSQKPGLSGGSGNRRCILAWHAIPERLPEMESPNNYWVPLQRSNFFQPRPDELDGQAKLPTLLLQNEADVARWRPHIVGLVGMNGLGKTCLALELVQLCKEQNHFPAGIFWINASKKDPPGYRQLAELAEQINFLPLGEQIHHPEKEQLRARYFCQYLAQHKDALLILDDMNAPEMIRRIFLSIIGKDVLCTILYTSSITTQPDDAVTYKVEPLTDMAALRLLLETTRPQILAEIMLGGTLSGEAEAARDVCRIVSNFPFALNQLRSFLTQDKRVSLQLLRERLTQWGILAVLDIDMSIKTTTNLNWELVNDEKEQRLFKLLSYHPNSVPMPLWLLGRACGLGEDSDFLSPLNKACQSLVKLSLLEVTLDDCVWLNPLLREFGQKLIALDSDKGLALRDEASQHLIMESANISQLEKRILNVGYWQCLAQVRAVRDYLCDLHSEYVTTMEHIETWLDRESALLTNGFWWPQCLPDLFYQQMYNRAVEESTQNVRFSARSSLAHWLLLEQPSGLEDYGLLRVLAGHDKGVKCATFSPDGRWVLTGSYDTTARIWDSENAECVLVLRGHTQSINSVAFSSDQSRVLTGSDDETARIWDRGSGNLLQTLRGHKDSVQFVAFSQDNKKILTAVSGKTIRIWDSESGRQQAQFNLRMRALNQHWKLVVEQQSSIAIWSAERRTLLTSLWDSSTGLSPTGVSVSSAAIANNSRLAVLGTTYNTAQIWNYEEHKRLNTLLGHRGWISSVAFSPDERYIATGSDDTVACIWDCATGEQLLLLSGHMERINAVTFSPHRQRLLTASNDTTARIWACTDEQIRQQRQAILQNVMVDETQKQKNEYQWAEATRGINSIVFSQNGELVALSRAHENIARIWDRRRRVLLTTLQGAHTDEIIHSVFSQNSELISTFSRDGRASIWKSTNAEMLCQWTNGYSVTSSMFSPSGGEILTNGGTSALLWDVKTGRSITTFRGHSTDVKSVMFFPNAEHVVTGSTDTTARIWNVKTAQSIAVLKHSAAVLHVSIIGAEQHILTYTADKMMHIWDWEHERELEAFVHACNRPYILSISPDASLIAVCDIHGQLVLLKNNEPGKKDIWGTYMAHAISTLYWPDNKHIVLASIAHTHDSPNFHQLRLEGLK